MYQAAEALKELYRSDSTEKNFIAEFRKSGESLPFLTIFDGTRFRDMTLEESLSSDENLNFGSCEASQIKLAVTELDTEVKGCEMTLYQTLEGLYPAPDLYPEVDVFPSGYIMPLGRYVIKSADRQANQKYREIVALDFMCKFDVDVINWYNSLPFPLTLRDFRARLCQHVGVTESAPEYLPNDDMLVEKTIEAAELIGRNVLIACEQANGAFGHFDRNGVLQHIILEPNCGLLPGSDTIPGPDLFSMRSSDMNDQVYAEKFDPYLLISCEMDEYTVQSIDKVQIRQEEGDVGAIYGTGTNCLTVEGNFLLFGKSASELNSIAQGIYGMASGRMYVPFHCDLKGLPYIEVGDSGSFDFGENRIISYVLKRTLKGIYALKDTYEATGEEIRSVENNVNTEIIQLKGKAAILRRNVDEVSANLIDFEKQTEALFKITAEEILAEVKRAQDAEAALSVRADQITASVKSLKEETEAQFKITANQITSEVTRAKEAEQSIITQTAAEISLKVSKGDVTEQLNSELKITGNSIDLTTGHFTIYADNITVDSSGNVSVNGEIAAHSGSIGNWTINNGTIEGDVGGFRGAVISGGHIVGTTIDVADGILQVEDGYGNSKAIVRIGAFVCSDEYGRGILQSADEMTGMSGDTAKSGGLYLWAGYNGPGDYALAVNNKNETHVRGSLHVNGSIYLNGSQISASGGSSSITGTTKKINIGYDVNGEWGGDWLEIYPKNLPDINQYPEYEGVDYFYCYLERHYKN